MDKSRKKELVKMYLETKSPMGILGIINLKENKAFIETTMDTKSKINSLVFQLNFGSCRIRTLQKDWNALGEENFKVEVLELLEYDKDENKTDYKEELKILKLLWEERLKKERAIQEFYH